MASSVQMTPSRAIGVAEGYEEAEGEDEYFAAWQYLLDSGLCWTLQGWFGRMAIRLLEEGRITAAKPKQNDEK
mgnify:CR=1 FL=1|jgi:hypothetical protein